MVPLLDQFYYFALTILIGMVSGFCYDLYKVTRGTLRLRRIGTALGDVLFWLILTGIVFVLLLMGNWGEVRLYVFLGLALGAVLYLNFFSHLATSVLQWNFRTINRLWKLTLKAIAFLWRILCLPFRILYLSVAIPVGFIMGIMGKVFRGTKPVMKRFIGRPFRSLKQRVRSRLSSIFPIFEYKDDE